MNRGTKIILLIIGGLVLIGLIVYFIVLPVFFSAQPAVKANANTNLNTGLKTSNTPLNTNKPVTNVPLPKETEPVVQQAGAVRTIAITFAERLSTFTNQNNLSNLNDLKEITTPAVWKYISGEYKSGLLKNMPDSKTYYAVDGTALNTSIVPVNDEQVNATIQIQRSETGVVSQITYATLNLLLKKVDGAWIVARLDWGK